MLMRFTKLALGCFAVVLIGSQAVAQSKGDRYNGVWTVSRGGGGMGRVFVDGKKVKGVLMDTGWYQMTGERRIGQLSGTLDTKEARIKIEWSTGATIEFRGAADVKRQGLSFTLTQYSSGREIKSTEFSLEAHRVGDPLSEPFGDMTSVKKESLAGEWSGSYVYGPNKGLAYVSMDWNGDCKVVMANERPNDDTWSAEGALSEGGRSLKLTVNSGFSKQAYVGKLKSIGPDQVQITFDREKGSFVMVLSRW